MHFYELWPILLFAILIATLSGLWVRVWVTRRRSSKDAALNKALDRILKR